jgi:hypothetical protein
MPEILVNLQNAYFSQAFYKMIKSYMASFLTKPKTKSETSSSTLQVQFKEIPNEDVSQDETLSEVIAVLETNDYNSNMIL